MIRSALVAIASVALPSLPASAQCPGQWAPSDGFPGFLSGSAYATLELPNGDLVVGGDFRVAGNVLANAIARWDGSAWHPMGSGFLTNNLPGSVVELALLANGDIIAAGYFNSADASPANNIARWNGKSWSPLGSGITGGGIFALTISPQGDVIVGGNFTHAGGAIAPLLARWDGAQWSPMGNYNPSFNVCNSLHTTPDGQILAGGVFQQNFNIIRWDTNAWTGVARLGNTNLGVLDFANLPNGDLVISGAFTTVDNVPALNIARWNGSAWSAFGAGLGPTGVVVTSIAPRPDNSLAAAGTFTRSGNTTLNQLAEWNGSAWTPLGAGIAVNTTTGVNDLELRADGSLAIVGTFNVVGGAPRWGIASWDGAEFHTVGAGFNDAVRALAPLPNGGLVAGGIFGSAGAGPARSVALYNGSEWSQPGAGFPPPQNNPSANQVNAVARLSSGDIFATGFFAVPGTQGVHSIARWDGTSWLALGITGLSGAGGNALAEANDGSLLIGGSFTSAGPVPARNMARWNNGVYSALGAGPVTAVRAIAVAPDNTIYVGGVAVTAANRTAMWNGSAWLPMGAGMNNSVLAMLRLPDGAIVAGGSFTTADGNPAAHVARWNGTAWSPMGIGLPNDVTALAIFRGELIAASSTFGPSAVYRWDGSAWRPLLTGFDRDILALAVESDDTVAVGGRFVFRDGQPAAYLLRWTPPSSSCAPDFNCDASLNSQDFFDFLAAFFSNSPTADYNHDSVINSQDFFDFLAAFFNGC